MLYDLRLTTYNLQLTTYDLRLTTYNLQLTTYDLRLMTINILGIESSCDDTSAAVVSNHTILSNIIVSQDIHKKYGGIVPELASRAHQQNIVPVVDLAIQFLCQFIM